MIRILRAGPDVSLNGSPTVSPTTAALCLSDPFPSPLYPASICFLALSHAPPALAIIIAINTPVTRDPANNPPRAATDQSPTTTGTAIASIPGRIISFNEECVEISTHLL